MINSLTAKGAEHVKNALYEHDGLLKPLCSSRTLPVQRSSKSVDGWLKSFSLSN
jgi:hypothetical protein